MKFEIFRFACLFCCCIWPGSIVWAKNDPQSPANLHLQVEQLFELQKLDRRVADIGWRLSTTNLEICPVHFAATGISLHTASQYDRAWRDAANEAFAFSSDGPSVLAVAEGSPAWEVGIRPNDRILSLDGVPFVQPSNGGKIEKGDYSETNIAMSRFESIELGRSIELIVGRGLDKFKVSISPNASCSSRYELVTSNSLNASSNGSVVQIFGRLVIALPNDNDLAIVMAHELAHNILEHNQSIRRSHMSTGFAAVWTGSGNKLRDFEREADRYGIFLAARAGYEYQRAALFWRRLSETGGLGAWIAVTHPTPKNRQMHAQAAIDEVKLLVSQGKPILPAGRLCVSTSC